MEKVSGRGLVRSQAVEVGVEHGGKQTNGTSEMGTIDGEVIDVGGSMRRVDHEVIMAHLSLQVNTNTIQCLHVHPLVLMR